jgi:hypothetical protein
MQVIVGKNSRRKLTMLTVLISIGCMSFAGAAVWGQQPTAGQPSTPAADSPDKESATKSTSSFAPTLAIHGFLSQAYAVSDGNQIIGIPKQGTADYRAAALQIRAGMTEADSFLVQLSHERNGLSPIQSVHPDVQLDWVFYDHKFGDSDLKVGRMPIPFGIYNEVRDVGTILPFFRPARPVYEETSNATETIDGVLLSHGFNLGAAGRLDVDVHYGNWKSYDVRLNPITANNSRGLELWLQTPVPGLRVGAGGFIFNETINTTPATRFDRQFSHMSIDGQWSRIDAQIEVKRDTSQRLNGGANTDVWGGYGLLGVHLSNKLVFHGEYDFLDVQFPHTNDAKDRDRALGASYFFRPNLVLKAEYHWTNGFRAENQPGLIPGRPVPHYITQFGILSLSTSF